MKLQVALDTLSIEEGIRLIESIREFVDIIEIGTPFVIAEGVHAVKIFSERFPEKELLSDEKIMDGGFYETELGLEAGADYVTVLSVADNSTVQGCLEAANKHDKMIVVDMICCTDMPKRIQELESMGAHMLAVHTGADQQAAGRRPIEDLKLLKSKAKSAKIAVAGGINSQTIKDYVLLEPDVVIVGSAICSAKDPVAEAKAIKAAMEG